jgi:hypothetical protein
MDLSSAWTWCEKAEKILIIQEGSLEARVRSAYWEALIHAGPFLPANYRSELQAIEMDLCLEQPLSLEQAQDLATAIVYICTGVSFRYAVEVVAVQRMHEGGGPRPLPQPPSLN